MVYQYIMLYFIFFPESVSEFGLFVLVLGVFFTSSMILIPILVFYSNRRNVVKVAQVGNVNKY